MVLICPCFENGTSVHLMGSSADKCTLMGGLDSLLSIVQMPKGVPVACVTVDCADNTAIKNAYAATECISFTDLHKRHDIGIK